MTDYGYRHLWRAMLWFFLGLAACNRSNIPPEFVQDPHSFARPEEARIEHLDLDLSVDFEASILTGTAVLRVDSADWKRDLILDTKQLDIQFVKWSSDSVSLQAAEYKLGLPDSILGRSLSIELPQEARYVHVQYSTRPGAEALQFLPPRLTNGDEPFLLTQSQAINARTWIPIQDSPGLRFTYHARVKVPEGLLALMSAENPTEANPSGVYEFEMTQPVPAYLLALAVGKLDFQPLGPRTGVYAEPVIIQQAAQEFAQLEQMMAIAEKLYGPYRWERHDILVLPPSFPFGGMENPRLTFATPTILTGDRSLVSLIAHELAHSWSGNLVTNHTWNDFWLNEGFTVYFECRIMEELKGRDYSEMLAQISHQELLAEVNRLGSKNPDTRLALDLTGRNPDDGMNAIPYDKGYYFLRYLEETVGREVFDEFLREYFNANAFKSMTSQGFVAYLDEHLLAEHPTAALSVDVARWIYRPGLPIELPAASSQRFRQVEKNVSGWIAGKDLSEMNTDSWSSLEWQHFIHSLPRSIQAEKLARLDSAYHFTQSTNSEVQCEWYQLALRAQYLEVYPAVRNFLSSVGRRKFLIPLYQTMLETPNLDAMAREIYLNARPGYHPIAIKSLDALFASFPVQEPSPTDSTARPNS